MKPVKLVVPGQPVPKERHKTYVRAYAKDRYSTRSYLPKKTRDWEEKTALLIREAWAGRPQMEGPVELFVIAAKHRTRNPDRPTWRIVKPDASNVLKAAEDALTKSGVIKDDNQVALSAAASLFVGKNEEPYVELRWGHLSGDIVAATVQELMGHVRAPSRPDLDREKVR